jgi:serine/threonine-protein kinase
MRPEARAAAPTLVGETLNDNYRLIRVIGEGAMGGIYEARQLRLDKRVAIKVLARELAANGEALLRFHREAEITSQLGHPHIITVFDFGTTHHGQPYLVMEYLEGEDLANRLHRVKTLALSAVVRITKQVASALADTHAKGIVHRDLKPANLFLSRVQGEDFAKVLDFGISKVRAASTSLTNASTLMGTPMYMAPEQAKGEIELDHWTDQWALACIAYEMLTGRPPFVGDDTAALLYQVVHEEPLPPSQVNKALPPAIDDVIRRALTKDPNERFPHVTAFARALEAAAMGRPLPLEAPAPVERAPNLPTVSLTPVEAAATLASIPERRAPPSGRKRRRLVWIGFTAAALGGVALVRAPWRRPPAAPPAVAAPQVPTAVAPAAPVLDPLPPPAAADPPEKSEGDEPAAAAEETDKAPTRPDKRDRHRRRPARRAVSSKRAAPPEPAPSAPVKRKLINEL